jgi:serine/threonine protein kinase/Flp pilus assembly protein TadD
MDRVHPTVETILADAVEIPSPESRQKYVAEACVGDQVLQREVERLIACHFAAGGFLESGAAEVPTILYSEIRESVGTHIGPYKLLEQIGEGGFGVVFMAEQSQPIRRRVALKILKPGMDTRQVIARFEAERQALALMDHPHIAKVLDAGATETGRPFFVMELVKGMPITRYCDEQRLPTRERLQLFVDVCGAIQHAHQKGIIHRDIKPSNVLVTLRDGKAIVKVIDFGVAKALGQQLTEKTIFTGFAQMVGTPLYMSPEQAALSAVDVDTRSDVYSLGVLLYELLTSTTPFSKETLSNISYDELRRIIREDEPPRPSVRISTLQAHAISTNAAPQPVDRQKLSHQLRGELDWIVMQALEKDRNRRYESASAFAADVERYLHDEAVLACPPSAMYRLRKFERRNRTLLTTGCLVALALLTGTAVSVWQAFEANRARALADERLVLANDRLKSEQQARRVAEDERHRADGERQRAEANFQMALEAVDRMTGIGDQSLSNVPQMEQVQKKILQDALEFYEGFVKQRSNDPKVRYQAAMAYFRVARVYAAFSQHVEHRKALETANQLLQELHAEQPDDATIRIGLADTWRWLGSAAPTTTTAESYHRRCIELLTPLVENPAAAGEYDCRPVLARSYSDLGGVLQELSRYDESKLAFRAAIALCEGRQGPDYQHQLSESYRGLAQLLERLGSISDSIALMQQSLDLIQRLLNSSPNSREYRQHFVRTSQRFGELLQRAQRPEEAVTHFQLAIVTLERLANEFPTASWAPQQLLTSRTALVQAYQTMGKLDEARRVVDQLDPRNADEYLARGKMVTSLGEDRQALADFTEAIRLSPAASQAYAYRSDLQKKLGDLTGALADAERVVELEPHSNSAHSRLVEIATALGNFREALDKADEIVQTYPELHWNWYVRGQTHYRMGDYARAARDYSEALQRAPEQWWIHKQRGLVYFKAGRYDEALADIVRAVELSAGDSTNLTWIAPALVAACPDEKFRTGILTLADKTIELTAGKPEALAAALAARGALFAAQQQWDRARADFEKATASDSATYHVRYQHALFCLAMQDTTAYQQACAAMLRRFRDSQQPDELHFAAWTCVLAADAVDDYAPAIELARRAVELRPDDWTNGQTLGAVLFRAGHFEEALNDLTKSADAKGTLKSAPVYSWYLLALTHHKLGHPEDARRWYDQATESTRKLLASESAAGSPVAWNRRLTLELLKAESAALLGNTMEPPASAAAPANVD